MPQRTLGDSITIVREELFLFSTELKFRDGDAADSRNAETPVASVSITRLINRAQTKLIRATGYTQAAKTITVSAGPREFTLPLTILDVSSVWLGVQRFRKTSIPALDTRYPTWRTNAAGTPKEFYVSGSEAIGFDRPFDAATITAQGTTLNFLATNDAADLANKTDTFTFLPTLYNDLPALMAVIEAAIIDAGNPQAQRRKEALEPMVNEMTKELAALMAARFTSDQGATPTPKYEERAQ
jgi:hypothetical protein